MYHVSVVGTARQRVMWLAMSYTLQIGGAVTPHDGQCHLRNITNGGEIIYYEYDEALRLVRDALHCYWLKEGKLSRVALNTFIPLPKHIMHTLCSIHYNRYMVELCT